MPASAERKRSKSFIHNDEGLLNAIDLSHGSKSKGIRYGVTPPTPPTPPPPPSPPPPATRDPRTHHFTPHPHITHPYAIPSSPSPSSMLLVDDSAVILKLMKRCIQTDFEKIAVAEAKNGVEGRDRPLPSPPLPSPSLIKHTPTHQQIL